MKRTFFTVSIVAAALMAGSQNLRADHLAKPHSEKSANDIIGLKVVNTENEDLGKVHDLIINTESGQVPYAVITTGGITGRTKVAVPLSALSCSTNGKAAMILPATKEQLQAASKTPTGTWAPAANSDWAKKVDGFYGQPVAERPFRDAVRDAFRSDTDGTRTYVRDPAPKGAELLMTPQDSALCQKIAEKTDVCNVQVQNGVAHLYGQVESEEARQKMESQVRSVNGVTKVESHLRVKNQQQ